MSQTTEQHIEQHNDQQPPDQQAPDQQAHDAHYYRRTLHELIDLGIRLTRRVDKQAEPPAEANEPVLNSDTWLDLPAAAPSPATTLDPNTAFERLVRAICHSVRLAEKITASAKAATAPKPDPRTLARKRIIRDVEDAIQRKIKANEAQRLHAELLDRLDAPDLDDDIASRPVAEIIRDICRDLGIDHSEGTHPWKRRSPADIAVLAARAATKAPARPSTPSAPPTTDHRPLTTDH